MLKKPNDTFERLTNETKIREMYKIIDVHYLDPKLVKSMMLKDEYYEKSSEKRILINNMLNYYINHKDIEIYKKTDYFCNKEEKICICNTHAEDFRKIVDGTNYEQGCKYISWFNTMR